ncbi:MAG TPA: SpoIIE family protein phosphatase [Thermoleophilaceae bacterium]|nr:SpoIIE family protein phosphatase [Thermoleophilaceae bacterium]
MAELGQRALAETPLEQLVEAAAAAVARELGTDYAAVLELTRDGRGLLVRAGVGFPEGVVGGVLPTSSEDFPGYALEAGGAVVIDDFAQETRFRPSPIHRDLGVVSALAAPIGARARRFGLIGAHSRTPQYFSTDDANFVTAVANVLGAAVERARHEDLVRDSEARFRELADTTPALMWVTDAEGNVTFVNEGWLRFTGRTLDEEIGERFALSAHPEDRDELLGRWRDVFLRRAEFRCEYRLRHAPSGDYRWVLEIGVPRRAQGDFLGYVGTATDIHERRAMEEALRESEASFRDLADTAPVMLWTTDVDGQVTFVNDGWLRFTGARLQDELGPSFGYGVHPEDTPKVLSTWEDALAARRVWEVEYRLRTRDGDHRWVVDRGVPRYEGGRFAGYVGAAVDIHERKTMAARLSEIYQREHDIATTLQRSLLPQRLPPVEGLALAARYLPAARGTAVGGDWYDALERPDGRVTLVVGDVAGHGLRAAATMGQLRNAFRALGLVESSPAEVMARVNRLVMSGGDEAMATVLYLVLDRETGEVVFSCAGHPPPLVLGPGGPRFLDGGRSVPVGATEPAAFREAHARLEPGSTLLLYTDGLVERRDEPLADRLEALASAAAAGGDDLDTLCDRILRGVLGDGEPADDVALLAVRPEPARSDRLGVTLPAEPDSLTGLRRRLGRFLHAAGASRVEVYEISLAICEAAGNAIEHAYGPGDASFELEAALRDGELTASVRDRGSWRERRSEHRGRGIRIIEGLMDHVEIATETGGTVVTMRRRLRTARAA